MPNIANTGASPAAGQQRIIGSGQTALGIATVSDVLTFTRQTGERVIPIGFITDNVANIPLGFESGAIGVGADAVILQIRKAGTGADDAKLTARSGISARTIDWSVLGIR